MSTKGNEPWARQLWNLVKEETASFLYINHFWHQVCGFSIPGDSPVLCRHHLGVLWFNSVLTLTPRVSTDPTGSGLSPTKKDANQKPGPPILLTDWLKIRGLPDPVLRFHDYLERFTKLRETPYLPGYHKGYHSGIARWKRCIGKGVG